MDDKYFDEKQNKRTKGIFYATISIVTLVVAIIGASFSYFIASASSNKNAIQTGSTMFSLDYNDTFRHLLNPDLIPTAPNIAYYAALAQDYATEDLYSTFSADPASFDKKTYFANTKCRDDNGNAVCSLYTFKITNPGTNSGIQTFYFKILPVENGFSNLYMTIVKPEELDTSLSTKAGFVIDEYHLGTDNLDYDSAKDEEYFNLSRFTDDDQDGVVECTDYCMKAELGPGESATYQLIIYIKNLEDTETVSGDQTAVDANKKFSAAIVIEPKDDANNRIYGILTAASGKFMD